MCVRYREQAPASPVAVEEVSLKGRSAGFLIVPVTLGFVLIVPVSDVHERVSQCSPLPVAVVPRATMWLPGSKAHPTEVSLDVGIGKKIGKNLFYLATLVLADHVVAASILLNGGSTLQ